MSISKGQANRYLIMLVVLGETVSSPPKAASQARIPWIELGSRSLKDERKGKGQGQDKEEIQKFEETGVRRNPEHSMKQVGMVNGKVGNTIDEFLVMLKYSINFIFNIIII
ncbi:hypothetical protein SELMODRAFT_427502 [Selaginella moellendorffii]|uniref:Uncharacterized protein n=1 Tax=Selaginella moellendorffii TaxID=88036 RepID=D8SZT8_SELML|nr:hypothetical protein SELMODRAFT_427502 [Selaginella moellendorffii]